MVLFACGHDVMGVYVGAGAEYVEGLPGEVDEGEGLMAWVSLLLFRGMTLESDLRCIHSCTAIADFSRPRTLLCVVLLHALPTHSATDCCSDNDQYHR